MPDYKNGKIYKIEGITNDGEILTYYGSTTQSLAMRLGGHKSKQKCSSALVISSGNYRIILVETFPCNSKEELTSREYHYIQNNECVNKFKYNTQICEHNRQRSLCKQCEGSQICEHNRHKPRCKECKGSQICEHNRDRRRCKECGGAGICEHKKRRNICKECGGGSICEHNIQRTQCKDCKGGSICEHNRMRSRCKDCKGGSICEHNRIRSQCKECKAK